MAKIHLSSAHQWPFTRQLPQPSMIWGEQTFTFNDNKNNTDFLVVYDEPHATLKTNIPKERRFLFISEPPSIKNYTLNFLNQFGVIFTPQQIDQLSKDTKQIIGQLALPWHYGVAHSDRFGDHKNYDELVALAPPDKINEISTMISSKSMNDRHRQRIQTTQFLKEKLGSQFHLLGRGFKEIDDKAQGIDPYAFHLICENNDIPNFWTEKLADAYLGYAFPVFSGCANLVDYFPEDSFISVDLTNPEQTLKTIKDLLDDPDFYKKRLNAIKESRQRVLNEYNVFAFIHNFIKDQNWVLEKSLENQIQITPQTPKSNPIKSIACKVCFKITKSLKRLKNFPYHLPLYFKMVNQNPDFFMDFYDRLGQKTMGQGYYSQRGQDWFLDNKIFSGKSDGIFLDVGANDPKELSNTLYFEEKGWTGLAFEPQERLRKKWTTDRKTECLPHLLGANDGEEVTFVEYDTSDWQNALSGVEGYAVEQGVNVDNMPKTRTKLLKRRLDNILIERELTHVDFMSLDVEGFEMEVLQGIDFSIFNIDVIVVENDRSHFGDKTLRKHIQKQGYDHIARLSGDDVFRKVR
ncbi:MAG: FkbM family methyltransferase [Bdellovibrionales bacterium]